MERSLSFGIIRSVSTFSRNLLIPPSAATILGLFSNEKGLVTTARVKIFACLQHFAMNGTAPVPVPPPIPHVIITMS